MFEPLYTADELRAAEQGHDVDAMMERAGRAVADVILRRYPAARRIAAVCGKGANGGDGRIALRVLAEAGRETTEVLDGKQDVVIDALFGTGFHGEPRADAAELIAAINDSPAPVVAVDVPSGVDASTGEVVGTAVRADLTVTMHGRKVGLAVAPGRFHAGEVEVADIGLEHTDTRIKRVTEQILQLVPRRSERDTKYSSGSVLVVGGSPGMTGAVCLAAEAAFRADAGYVAVAVPSSLLPIVETLLVEAVKAPRERVDELAKRATALAIGPGLGRGDEERSLARRLLAELERPAVVDADALFELEPAAWPAPRVLTPHAGELARLIGAESDWVGEHRLEALARAVERFGCVVLLKGADTLVGAPGEAPLVCDSGTAALATAGTGDVLTGVIASFLSKGMDARLAAAAGAFAHGRAAALAPQQVGLVASDVIDSLPLALA
ncbi:MAG: ADP-dependent NAD(P)H-hydrate dehydratase / NAD(P)H-hydrate epimerase [Gaiellaceae bacterium]|nr:ADP-dependent NAD(P)H-hydrate dehydratase / NAD(P)H-hydrate epimerase [Gaiellaceae bacterium]